MFIGPPLRDVPDLPAMAEMLHCGAQVFPNRTAVIAVELGASWTYRELHERVGRAQALLQHLGLRQGDRLAYIGRNSDNFPIVLFAAVRSGLVLVALNWRSPAAEMAYFLEDSGARVVFVDAEFRPLVEAAQLSHSLDHVIDTESSPGREGLRRLLDDERSTVDDIVGDATQACLLLYTSGTTGQPKGAIITQRTLTLSRQVEFSAEGFPPTGEDRILIGVPIFHLGGLTMLLIGLVRGAECILTSDPSAPNLLALCRRYDVTLTWLVPTMMRSFVDLVQAEHAVLPSFRTMMYGSAPMWPELLLSARSILGCGFSNAYGATEIGAVTILPPQDHRPDEPELLKSVGRAMPGAAIDIRDKTGVSLPPRSHGEVWVKTPTVMSGYWNRPAETAEAIVDGWYRTGDGGYLDERGYLYLTDRIKDMIVSGGENIYPLQVENVLRLHPAVEDVAVVGMADSKWGEAVLAVIQLRAGHVVTEAELIGFARPQLAGYKCPKAVRFVASFPRTASGKIQRGRVRKSMQAETA